MYRVVPSPLASGISHRNTPVVECDILPMLRYKPTALGTCFLLNPILSDDTGLPLGRYHSLIVLIAFGVSLSPQHSVLGVTQNNAALERFVPMTSSVTRLLFGYSMPLGENQHLHGELHSITSS